MGPFGPLGPLRGPKGPLGLGGYSEAISNGWPLRMEGNFDWNAISNGRSFGYMGLLPNSAPARLNQPFRFKNIPSKSAVFTPMLSRPAEAPTKTGAEIHPKPSSIHVEIVCLMGKFDRQGVGPIWPFLVILPLSLHFRGFRPSGRKLIPLKPTFTRDVTSLSLFKLTFSMICPLGEPLRRHFRGVVTSCTPFKPTFTRVAI